MNKVINVGRILALVLCALTSNLVWATESQLTIDISGAISVSENVYIVGVPEGTNTVTVTITGSGTVDPPENGICKQYCPDGTTVKASTNASADGDPRYTFSAGAGTQNPATGPSITWTIKSDTALGSYDFQLTKIEQDYKCPEDFGGAKWTEDNSQASVVKKVWVVKAEVTSVKFTSDHGILKDNNSTWADGGTVYSEPEWTSSGTNNPISHTKNSNISLELNINYSPAGAPGTNCDVSGTGLKGYDKKTVALTPGGNPVSFTSKDKLDDKVYKLEDSINWTLAYAGTTATKESGKHKVYVTYDTPAGSGVTEKRVAWVVNAADGKTAKDDCAKAVFDQLTSTTYDLSGPMWGPTDIWVLHDGPPNKSQCPGLAKYIDAHFQMLGLGAGAFRFCHATAAGGYIADTAPNAAPSRGVATTVGHGSPTTHDDENGNESLVHWDGNTPPGPNSYEATCLFNGKHYACGVGVFNDAKAVVKASFTKISWEYVGILAAGPPKTYKWVTCGDVPWVEAP